MAHKVSIVISAYNAEKYIAETLKSVLQQTWLNLEVIVVNDGSTDNTTGVCASFKQERLKVISQENKGQDAALNTGYQYSSGDYIKFMDSDDLLNPEMIERQMEVLDGSEDFVAYGEWARFYDDNFEAADFTPLSYWMDAAPLDFLTAEPCGVMLQCGIMLIPRKLIEKAGLWNEGLILFNDTEFFNRIIINSNGIKFSPGARLYYRSGMLNSISAGEARKFYESTYLAANLIAEQLLPIEDSARIRRLISNTYLMQYYRMYPKFSDLQQLYVNKIEKYGYGDLNPYGGTAFVLLKKMLGWKVLRRLQVSFYKLGYLKIKRILKQKYK